MDAFEEALNCACKKAEEKLERDKWLTASDVEQMIDEELISRNIYPVFEQPWISNLRMKGFTTPIIE